MRALGRIFLIFTSFWLFFLSFLEILFGNIPDIPCKIFREERNKPIKNPRSNIIKTRSTAFVPAFLADLCPGAYGARCILDLGSWNPWNEAFARQV